MMIRRRAGALLVLALLVVVAPAASDHIPVLNQDVKLLASNGQPWDFFGISVAVDGDTMVVGAEQRAEFGGGPPGAAYVFERDQAGLWVEVAKLLASDGENEDRLGESVAIDGDTIVVGARGDDDLGEWSGAAYVFKRNELGDWLEVAKLLASDGETEEVFGGSVAVDSDKIVVGAALQDDFGFQSGAAYVFERTEEGAWLETAKLLASDGAASDAFGDPVAINGDRIVVGARGDDDRGDCSGSVYIFERTEEGVWLETAKLVASDGEGRDNFGGHVAIAGDILAVGAVGNDDLELGSGAAYIFERTELGSWVETAKLFSPHPDSFVDGFGRVAVSGETIVVGATGGSGDPGDRGSVDLFRRGPSGEWINAVRFLASDGGTLDKFGGSVMIDGDTVLVGARSDTDLGEHAGSAYIFHLRPYLTAVGTCPGSVDITLTGATADGSLGLLWAAGEGTTTVPGGPCPGVVVGLADPSLLAMLTADPDGNFSATPTVPEPACGRFLQAVNLTTCKVSNVEQLP